MIEPQAWIISGVPGAGKTTVARLLASKLERGVHLEGDLIGDLIVSGRVAPDGQPRQEAQRQLDLRRRNVSLLAGSFLEADFSVVIDDVVVSVSVLDRYVQSIASPLRFVQLHPSLEVVQARDRARDKHVFDVWSHLQHEVDRMDRFGLWLDTSTMSADDTVIKIIERADEAIFASGPSPAQG